MRKLLAFGALAGFAAAIWRYLSQPLVEPAGPATAPTAATPSAPASTASASTASKAASTGGSRRNGGSPTSSPTKEELYKRATALGIEGRSKMTKAELEAAISRAS
ncbi:MAG: hypothetical protein QOJ38_206 [Solirubrobacterales bacterium]|jgi:hypothetical protein|nr:hypothetical protein [Solirubrobacterales bacterium]